MSDVKMCDNCGNVFSVNEPGWEEFTRTQSRSDGNNNSVYNNSNNHGAITQHIGPCCKLGQGNVMRPRIAMQELETGEIDTGYKGQTGYQNKAQG